MADAYYCERCNKTMSADNFYGTNNLESIPMENLNYVKNV